MWWNPQVGLAHMDEGRDDGEDGVGDEMYQFNLVLVQQSSQEVVGGDSASLLDV
jgi:hypothetical protein